MGTRRCVVAGILVVVLICVLSGCDWIWVPGVPAPQTLGLVPQAGAVHTLVTIVGVGFGDAPAGAAVTFDGVEASVEAWSETNIVARVPILATPAGRREVPVEVSRAGVVLGQGGFAVLRGILFETHRDGNAEIYVMNPDGTQPINLTNDPADDFFAAWSPDGTKIAFESRRDGNTEIYVMGADGSSPTNLTQHPDSDYFPTWSPNGRKIAFMTNREAGELPPLKATERLSLFYNVEIFVMNADGSGQTNLSVHIAWDGYPSWSPDGDRIVFQSDRDDTGIHIMLIGPDGLGREIYAMDADGTDQTRLSNSPEDDFYPSWSPDGSRIAFQSYRDGNGEIYVMNPDGSGQLRITNHPSTDSMPTWSPDGGWISFHSFRDGDPEIYKTTATGASTTRLTNTSGWDGGPSWSPDGTQIVFQSSRDGNPEIYRMNANGSAQDRLTTELEWDFRPIWGTFGWMPPV